MTTPQPRNQPTDTDLDPNALFIESVEALEQQAADPEQLAEVQRAFPEFEVLCAIGRGGMACVYKCRDPQLDRYLALKIMDSALGREPGFAERFGREAQTLAGLQHPHLLRILDYGERQGLHFLATEYFEGGSLRELIAKGPLEPAFALRLLREFGGALAYAHDQGLVHRDIKPSNVLIDAAGHACLADFGIVHQIAPRPETADLTETAQALGTPHYMAPEVMVGEVNARSDIFSLGVVAYEMLTGKLPIGRFTPASETCTVGSHADRAIDRCLRTDPRDRWSSVDEMITAIGSDASTVAALPPLWLVMAKWCGGCLAFFAIVEGMEYVAQRKVLDDIPLLPVSFALETSLVAMGLGTLWMLLDRLWQVPPRATWLRSMRRMMIRFLRSVVIWASITFLLVQMNDITRLHSATDTGFLTFLLVQMNYITRLHSPTGTSFLEGFTNARENVLLVFEFFVFGLVCLFLIFVLLMVLEIVVPIMAARRRRENATG